ncbi:MAG: hypothetical protein QXV32_02050 [Conexivisphaerales archaeon]
MSGRRNFNLEYIQAELQKLSSSLETELPVYGTVGCAMAYYRLKEGTKDTDFVVRTAEESGTLVGSLLRISYHQLKYATLGNAHRGMNAQAVVENRDGFRWDVFTKKVVNKLTLTDSMMKRATKTYDGGRLKLFTLSNEDVFLMKGVTDLELDQDDMKVMTGSGLDYDVILKR